MGVLFCPWLATLKVVEEGFLCCTQISQIGEIQAWCSKYQRSILMTAFWTGCKWSSWRRLELATSDWQQNLIGLEIWEDSCLRNLEQLFWHAVLLLYLPQFLTYLLNNAFWNPDFIIVLVVRWKHTALHKATLHALCFHWVILGQTLVSCFYLLNIRGKLLQQRSESLTSI